MNRIGLHPKDENSKKTGLKRRHGGASGSMVSDFLDDNGFFP
jgi:hypothetical protein